MLLLLSPFVFLTLLLLFLFYSHPAGILPSLLILPTYSTFPLLILSPLSPSYLFLLSSFGSIIPVCSSCYLHHLFTVSSPCSLILASSSCYLLHLSLTLCSCLPHSCFFLMFPSNSLSSPFLFLFSPFYSFICCLKLPSFHHQSSNRILPYRHLAYQWQTNLAILSSVFLISWVLQILVYTLHCYFCWF